MNEKSNQNAIVLEHVQKSFGKKEVLKDVTGSIQYGKTIGLLGRNGEGKTTLFRILLDILAFDRGTVRLEGHTPDGSGKIQMHRRLCARTACLSSFHDVQDVFQLPPEHPSLIGIIYSHLKQQNNLNWI